MKDMEIAIRCLRAEIVNCLEMKIQYERIRLEAMKDKKSNLQVDLMVKFYQNQIDDLELACEVLGNYTKEK